MKTEKQTHTPGPNGEKFPQWPKVDVRKNGRRIEIASMERAIFLGLSEEGARMMSSSQIAGCKTDYSDTEFLIYSHADCIRDAAPELLAACKEAKKMLAVFHGLKSESCLSSCDICDFFRELNGLIAKAEGR